MDSHRARPSRQGYERSGRGLRQYGERRTETEGDNGTYHDSHAQRPPYSRDISFDQGNAFQPGVRRTGYAPVHSQAQDTRRLGGPPPNLNVNRHRRRSRSPNPSWRRSAAPGDREMRDAGGPHSSQPTHRGLQNNFPAPRADTRQTRPSQQMSIYSQSYPAPQGNAAQRTESQTIDMLELLASGQVDPSSFPGEWIDRSSPAALGRLTRGLNVVGYHAFGRMHSERYGPRDKRSAERVNQGQIVGAIGMAAIHEPLLDDNVAMEDLDRSNSIHGPGSAKERRLVLLAKRGRWMQVVSATTFSNQLEPPEAHKDEYAYFLPESDDSARQYADLPTIRHSDNGSLKERSFLRLYTPHSLPLETSVVWKGRITPDSYEPLADALQQRDDHQLRQAGRRLLQEQDSKLAETGNTEETIAARRERFARQAEEKQEQNALFPSPPTSSPDHPNKTKTETEGDGEAEEEGEIQQGPKRKRQRTDDGGS